MPTYLIEQKEHDEPENKWVPVHTQPQNPSSRKEAIESFRVYETSYSVVHEYRLVEINKVVIKYGLNK